MSVFPKRTHAATGVEWATAQIGLTLLRHKFVGCAKSRCEVCQCAQPRGAILRTRSAENRAVAHPTPSYAPGLVSSRHAQIDKAAEIAPISAVIVRPQIFAKR